MSKENQRWLSQKLIYVCAWIGTLLPCLVHAQVNEMFSTDLTTDKNPWTNLDFFNDPNDFQFAIVSDRTGSPREGVFEDAMMKINWLMPEFVITVGDMIRGAKGEDKTTLDKQWSEHFERIDDLKMPFFHVAGNHDVKANNSYQVKYWNDLFGSTFYSFKYKEVLFLVLFTNEGTQILGDEQVKYFEDILAKNDDVRWTLVFMHHPLWRYPHMSNFEKVEEALDDRDYTVFAGHQHVYNHQERNKTNYYVLASTGGGSELLGDRFGMFDHITWVTMTDDGPILANLRLDGILPHDIANNRTEELSLALIKSVFYESKVFVDSNEDFMEGKAVVTYRNTSELPLRIEAEFMHDHYVQAFPKKISEVIPAQSLKQIVIDLKAIKPFSLEKKVALQLEGALGYLDDDHKNLSITGRTEIIIESSPINIIPQSDVNFIDHTEVVLSNLSEEDQILYTLDGSDPRNSGKIYLEPIKIDDDAMVKAVIRTEEGWFSEVDEANYKKVKSGKGLRAEIYAINPFGKSSITFPDFDTTEPEKIRYARKLDPVATAGMEAAFAIRYTGTFTAEESGKYEFRTYSDDGIRLFVNGQLVLEDAVKHKSRLATGTIDLENGEHELVIHYFQWKRGYDLRLSHISPSGREVNLIATDFSYD